jgi:response regulator RpfG family c-di-GMP phosphodiesterase
MILLISRNEALAKSFIKDLKQEGFMVEKTDNLRDIRAHLYRHPKYRMVIVDLESLENMGLEVFQQLKEDSNLKYLPLLCIIKKDLVVEQLMAFELGADDFIFFPYTTLELQLKMRTIQGLFDLQSQLKEKESKIKVLQNTQKILVTISHYINNSLSPLYNLVQNSEVKSKSEIKHLIELSRDTIEFVKKVFTALNNYVQTGQFSLTKDGIYRDLMLDIEKELQNLDKPKSD